jgi:hypothetical protein
MELRRQGQVEGWQKDPYGRHELRFFDGHRWTPYVRDGETNGLDEPVGPMAEEGTTAARGGLLAEELLVVERHVDLGRRNLDRVVRRADGSHAGVLRTASPASVRPALRSLVVRDAHKGDTLELVDEHELLQFSLLRPVSAPKSTVVVRSAEGRDAGRIAQQSVRTGATTFALLGPNSAFLGDLQAENWVSWDLWIDDARGRRVATITRDWDGLDRSAFPSTDDYVVRIQQPVPEPLRTLVLAAALSLDVALRPETRGV